MGNLDSQTSTILAVVVVLVLVALAAWYFVQKRQSERLQQRFGPEYGRTVDVHVLRLRKALGRAKSLIKTVRGAGYMLSAS